MTEHKSGTALVIKGEPSATDTALLRRTLDANQKRELQQIMGALVRNQSAAVITEED